MESMREIVCCVELGEVLERLDDGIVHYGCTAQYTCITEHPALEANCLRWDVLEVAWLAYKQHYGPAAYESNRNHKRLRHVAYRQLARFLFGIVGKHNRYVLPSRAVSKIRETFPAPDQVYTQFETA